MRRPEDLIRLARDKSFTRHEARTLVEAGLTPLWAVYMFIGDSNILGGGGTLNGPQQLPGQQDSLHPNVFSFSQDNEIVPAIMPIGEFEGSQNVDLSQAFGRTLAMLHGNGVNILLVQCAAGGTSFGGNNWNPGDALYENAVTRVNAALNREGAWLGGIISFFGNIDAGNETNANNFEANLDAMIDALRGGDINADMAGNQETTPVVVGTVRIGDYRATVNTALRTLPKRKRYTFCIEAEDLDDGVDEGGDDAVHFASYARRELGRRFATAIERARSVSEYDRPISDADITSFLAGSSGASVEIADTPPASPADSDLWWNSEDGNLYIYYDDGSSSQWVTTSTPVQGDPGDTGWSSSLSVISDGARRVLQISDWVGGTGDKPATGQYIGASGLVASPGAAVDIRGAAGADGVDAAALTFNQSRWTFTDFGTNTTTMNPPWTGAAISSGTSGVANYVGSFNCVRLGSSATANSGYRWTTVTDTLPLVGMSSYCVVATTGGLADRLVRIGYHTTTTSTAPANGIYFEWTGADLTFRCTRSSATSISSPVYTLEINTEYHLLIDLVDVSEARGRVFDSSGTLLYDKTLTTDVPTGNLRHGVVATHTQGLTNGQLLFVEYMGFGPSKPPFIPA